MPHLPLRPVCRSGDHRDYVFINELKGLGLGSPHDNMIAVLGLDFGGRAVTMADSELQGCAVSITIFVVRKLAGFSLRSKQDATICLAAPGRCDVRPHPAGTLQEAAATVWA